MSEFTTSVSEIQTLKVVPARYFTSSIKMPPRRQPLKKPKAAIGYLADLEKKDTKTSHVGKEVVERVRKCFARANHENANEQEARAASRMAAKIMEQYQITQADIMAEEDSSERAKRGGMSTVSIWPAKDGGRAFTPGWVDWLIGAIDNFFDCRSFSTGYDNRIQWTFYGISEHTVSGAIAFEAVHNQVQDLSERYTGVSTRNSYCLGVADGLLKLSKEEQKATEERVRKTEADALAARIKEEELKQHQRLSRLRSSSLQTVPEYPTEYEMDMDDAHHDNRIEESGYASEASDNEVLPDFQESNQHDGATVNTEADFDTELRKFIPSSPSTLIGDARGQSSDEDHSQQNSNTVHTTTEAAEAETSQVEGTVEWKSVRQLTTYREMSKDIEDQVLKERKIKLRKKRKNNIQIKNRDVFKKGQQDAKKIEVRAARIESKRDRQQDDMDIDDSN